MVGALFGVFLFLHRRRRQVNELEAATAFTINEPKDGEREGIQPSPYFLTHDHLRPGPQTEISEKQRLRAGAPDPQPGSTLSSFRPMRGHRSEYVYSPIVATSSGGGGYPVSVDPPSGPRGSSDHDIPTEELVRMLNHRLARPKPGSPRDRAPPQYQDSFTS